MPVCLLVSQANKLLKFGQEKKLTSIHFSCFSVVKFKQPELLLTVLYISYKLSICCTKKKGLMEIQNLIGKTMNSLKAHLPHKHNIFRVPKSVT